MSDKSLSEDWDLLRKEAVATVAEEPKVDRPLMEDWADVKGLPELLYMTHASTFSSRLERYDAFYVQQVRPYKETSRGHMKGYAVFLGKVVWAGPLAKPHAEDTRLWARKGDCYATLPEAMQQVKKAVLSVIERDDYEIENAIKQIKAYQASLKMSEDQQKKATAFLKKLSTP